MSDPRQWQVALEKVRQDLQKIHSEIEQYAGKSNKPLQVSQQINLIIQQLDNVIPVLLQHNPYDRAAQQMYARWAEFKNVWKNGKGSWTQCKEITPALVGYMNAFEL
jgi:hypothetical protein